MISHKIWKTNLGKLNPFNQGQNISLKHSYILSLFKIARWYSFSDLKSKPIWSFSNSRNLDRLCLITKIPDFKAIRHLYKNISTYLFSFYTRNLAQIIWLSIFVLDDKQMTKTSKFSLELPCKIAPYVYNLFYTIWLAQWVQLVYEEALQNINSKLSGLLINQGK